MTENDETTAAVDALAADRADAGAEPTEVTPAEADWRSDIPDGRLRKFAERFAGPADAVKSAFELRQKLSNAVELPREDSPPEAVAEFRKRLGVPEAPDGYDLRLPAVPEGVSLNHEIVGQAAALFYKHGVPQAAAQAFLDDYVQLEMARLDADGRADGARRDRTLADLRLRWGDDFDRNVDLAQRAFREFLGEAAADMRLARLPDGRLVGSHPGVIEAFARIGRSVGEGGHHAGGGSGGTRQDDEARLDSLTRGAHAADAAGDRATAEQLFRERSTLAKLLYG